MEPSTPPMPDPDLDITATVMRERTRLGQFIRRRVSNPAEAEDILQDVFEQLVEAYRLPAPLEQATAWLYRIARNRIIDRFRKKKELPLDDLAEGADDDPDIRLDLALPASADGPEAAYARSVVLQALQRALDELPAPQREVFIAHELDGLSFKALAASTGVPLNTLLSRKRYAVLQLRERLQSVYDELDL